MIWEGPRVRRSDDYRQTSEAFGIGSRHDQTDPGSILRADGATQLNVFRMSWHATCSLVFHREPSAVAGVHAAKAHFVQRT
jgi:hypothetical protein